MGKKQQVDIIGAGISGMATAFYLSRQRDDVHIRVWEKDKFPGGLAGAFETDDFSVEKFYHHIFKRDKGLQQLIADVGLADELSWRPAATGSYYFQQPYRLSAPLDLLKFKPLPFLSRIRLGMMVLHARTVKDWEKLDDTSVKDYILKYGGKKVYEVVWKPLLEGKFGKYADEVSAAWLWCKLVDRGSSRNKGGFEYLGYLKGGLGRMFEAMMQELRAKSHEVHLNQGVEALSSQLESGRISHLRPEGGDLLPTDFVVSCTQTPQLARMLPDSAAQYRADLEKIKFLSNVCLVLTLDKSLSEFYWTNVTDPEAPFVGIIEQTKWADRKEFNDKHLVYISSYVPYEDERLKMSAEELLAFYLPYIQKIFPDFSEERILDKYLWKAAYTQPIVHVGYRHNVPATQSPLDNLLVATMAQIYPNDRQVSNGVDQAKKTVALLNQKIAQAAELIDG